MKYFPIKQTEYKKYIGNGVKMFFLWFKIC